MYLQTEISIYKASYLHISFYTIESIGFGGQIFIFFYLQLTEAQHKIENVKWSLANILSTLAPPPFSSLLYFHLPHLPLYFPFPVFLLLVLSLHLLPPFLPSSHHFSYFPFPLISFSYISPLCLHLSNLPFNPPPSRPPLSYLPLLPLFPPLLPPTLLPLIPYLSLSPLSIQAGKHLFQIFLLNLNFPPKEMQIAVSQDAAYIPLFGLGHPC